MERAWKERITKTKHRELEKRGVVVAKTAKERKDRLQEANERGGIVFVSKQAEKELNG